MLTYPSSMIKMFGLQKAVLQFLLVILSISRASAAPNLVNAKDMFYQELKGSANTSASLSGASAPADTSIAYCLELHRGSAAPVLCNNRYAFRSGDGIRIHVKTSSPLYAYIVLLQGSSGKQAILYPPPGSTEDNRLMPGKECMVPPKGMIVFDNQPGVEKLGLIFSPRPLEDSKVLSTRSIPIDSDVLTGIPQKAGPYSVLSNDGVYDLGEKSTGNGLVFVHNPEAGKATGIAVVLNHGGAQAEPPASHPGAPSTPSSPSAPSSGGGGSAKNRAITDKWAFIVGLNHFANFPQNSLRYCVADATSLRDFLVNESGFKANHVYLLTDEQATTPNIMRVMTELLPRAVRKDDLVLLYFSTHGTPDMHGENYIVTYDFDGKGKTGVPMSTMSDMIRTKIPSDRVVTMIDTCFSGNAKDLLGDPAKALDPVLSGCGQLILTACSANQTSLEDPKLQHGYFTYYLLDAFRTKKGVLAAFDQTKNEVPKHTNAEHGQSQTPVLKRYWEGNDVYLFTKPTNPRS